MEGVELRQLPETWAWTSFGEQLDIQGGSQPAKKFFSSEPFEGSVRLYQIRDLGGSPVPVYVDKRKVTKFCRSGDIMIGRYGASVGKVFWGRDGAYNVALVKVLFDEDHWDTGFLYHFLKSPYFQQPLRLISKTAQDGFNKTDLSRFPLPAVPLNEQLRIVEKIEMLFARLDKGEEAVREVKKLLTRYRQSILKSAVTGQLTANWRAESAGQLEHGRDLLARILRKRREQWQGRGKYKDAPEPNTVNLSEMPPEWVWASLAQLTSLKGGVTVDRKREANDPVTLPYLRVANVQNGYLDLSEMKEITVERQKAEQCLLEDGDILLNEGGDLDKLGRGWVWRDEIKPCIHQNHVFRARPVLSELSSEFISYYANAFGQGFFMDKGKQSVNLASISLTAISGLPVPLPPLDEQAEIVRQIGAKLSELITLREWCETELKRSASLRQSILKDAFSGRLVPQDPSDEPASMLLARINAADTAARKRGRKRATG